MGGPVRKRTHVNVHNQLSVVAKCGSDEKYVNTTSSDKAETF